MSVPLDLRGVKPFKYESSGNGWDVKFYGRRIGKVTRTRSGWTAMNVHGDVLGGAFLKTRGNAAQALVEWQAPFPKDAA